MGLFVMAFMGIMPISGLLFGSLGEFIGPSNAVLVGSVALIIWAMYLELSQALVRSEPAIAD